MIDYKFNPFTGKLDATNSDATAFNENTIVVLDGAVATLRGNVLVLN